jgi:hypothetical protein
VHLVKGNTNYQYFNADTNNKNDDIRSFNVFNNKLYGSCKDSKNWKLIMVIGKNSTTSVTRLQPVNKSIIYHDKLYVFTEDFGDGKTFWVPDGLTGGITTLLGFYFNANIDEAIVGDNLYFSSWFDRPCTRSQTVEFSG